jgi:hypothetical protein
MLVKRKRLSPRLSAWRGLRALSAPCDTQTATTAASSPQAMHRAPALIAALAICGVLGGISLLVPPFIQWDSGYGFLAWRGTLLGAANSIITPDPANIALDNVEFLAFLSPGQYLIPGAISLMGVPLGIAMTLTAALSLLASLIGWVMVVQAFAPRTSLALLVTVLIGSFRYSTSGFGIYHGGEILLNAATPWLVLAAYRVPEMDAIPAALLAAGAVFFAFFAKLTGLIVVAAALVAGSLVVLAFGRRITRGMVGGALGALAAFAILYVVFLSRGWTAVSVANWSLPFRSIALAFLAPWVAGMSWSELMTSIFFPTNGMFDMPIALLALVVPPAILVAGLVLFWRPQTIDENKLRLFSLWFYGIVAAVFILLYIHGALIGLEERHFRSVGTLLFVCALMSAFAAGTPRWTRSSFFVLCTLMALYGLASFSSRALTAAKGQSLDRTSWTNQAIYDAAAIDFAREAYAREGRDGLFVFPSHQIAVTFPTEARIITIELQDPESAIAGLRYRGRFPGHVFVLIPNWISDTSKGRALLSAFTDYAPDAWERRTFANMTVFFQ